MVHKKGKALKQAITWVLNSEEPASPEILPDAYRLVDWYNKKLGIGILDALTILAAYSPRRLEELDAQRQIETEE